MIKIAIFILIVFVLNPPSSINAQTASTIPAPSSTTTSVPTSTAEPLDCSQGGKVGNPGAQLSLAAKALDDVHQHAMDKIAQAIRAMVIPDVVVPLGTGFLTIKAVRVIEAKFGAFDRQMQPPNRIRSRLINGQLKSIGQWQFRPFNNGNRQLAGGLFRVLVVNTEMNVTTQLGRNWDGRPSITCTDCKAYLGQFRVEIEGFGPNTTVINQCDNLMCKKIRAHFEEAVCQTARSYARDSINTRLSTFPTRVNLGPSEWGNRFVLNYGLILNEPKVTEKYIHGYLEGEVLSRGSQSAPLHASDLAAFDDQIESTIFFTLSDFAFNTLLHHAHAQQYRFSAFDHLPSTSPIKDHLKLECPLARSASKTRAGYGGTRQSSSPNSLCLGSVFENTSSSSDSSDTADKHRMGDLVFKSQRPLQILVRAAPMKSSFGVDGGMIEAYGPVGSNGKRELLGRADIQSMRGEFMAKMSECNITGLINITDLQLTRASPAIQARARQLPDPVLSKLAQLSIPVFKEMFNIFFGQFAQFPIPLIDGFACEKTSLRWLERTMRVDADVRILPEATRVGAKKN